MKKNLHVTIFTTLMLLTACILPTVSRKPFTPKYTDLIGKLQLSRLQLLDNTKSGELFWRPDGTIIAFQTSVRDMHVSKNNPYEIVGEKELHYLDLEKDHLCRLTIYRRPSQLPDGRVGFIKSCVTDSAFTDKLYWVAYDFETKSLEQIAGEPIVHSGCATWNSEMTRGIHKNSDGMGNFLNWLTATKSEPIHITLQSGDKSWDMSKSFGRMDQTGYDALASCPAWKPNSDQIALFVSFSSMDAEGMDRLDQPYDLVFFDANTGASRTVLQNFYSVQLLGWSPDGSKLAFRAYYDIENKQSGLWLYDATTDTLYLLAKKLSYGFAWSPDSPRQFVANLCDTEDCESSAVYRMTLPDMP